MMINDWFLHRLSSAAPCRVCCCSPGCKCQAAYLVGFVCWMFIQWIHLLDQHSLAPLFLLQVNKPVCLSSFLRQPRVALCLCSVCQFSWFQIRYEHTIGLLCETHSSGSLVSGTGSPHLLCLGATGASPTQTRFCQNKFTNWHAWQTKAGVSNNNLFQISFPFVSPLNAVFTIYSANSFSLLDHSLSLSPPALPTIYPPSAQCYFWCCVRAIRDQKLLT